jgi:large subunit ribosomal protein L25
MATAQVPGSASPPKSTRPKDVGSQSMPVLRAELRWGSGKSEAHRLRATGKIPAVAYGRGLPSTSIAVTPKEVVTILKSDRGRNSVIEMQLGGDGKKLLVMIRDFSYHPVRRDLEHVDFIQVKLDEPVDVQVPLLYTGKPAGVVAGGIVRHVFRTVPVRCLPDRIPLKLEIDITHLNMNEHVSTQELSLPEGVTVLLPAEQTLIAVVAPEKEQEEVPVDAAAVAAGAVPGAPGAAAPGAVPAAGEKAAEGGKDVKGGAAAAAPAKEDKKKK